MRYIFILILLSGCATHPEYKPYDDNTESTWRSCNFAAWDVYNKDRSSGGMFIGGILLGPVGAVVGDQLQNQDPKIKPEDVDGIRASCMASKGYTRD